MKKMLRRWGALCGLALAVGSLVALHHAGFFAAAGQQMDHAALRASRAVGLQVNEVLLVGRHEAPMDAVREALGIDRGDPILTVDLHAARERIERLAWVETAVVERRLPDALLVRIVERQPLARWRDGKRMKLVDRAGAVFETAEIERFRDLPELVGDGAPAATAELIDLLGSHPQLAARVLRAERVGGRRWDIHFEGGATLRLPEADAALAWSRFGELAARENLLDRGLLAVDFRLPDRVIVRLPEGTTQPPVKSLPAVASGRARQT